LSPSPAWDKIQRDLDMNLHVMRRRLQILTAGLALPLLLPARPAADKLVPAPESKASIAKATSLMKPLMVWTGLASWYGYQFEGHTTASGQMYDGQVPTAAHQWLPFGSLLRLTNLKTGRSQVVRVNDRGPYEDNRELDLSFIAASELGVLQQGVVKLKIELLEAPQRF